MAIIYIYSKLSIIICLLLFISNSFMTIAIYNSQLTYGGCLFTLLYMSFNDVARAFTISVALYMKLDYSYQVIESNVKPNQVKSRYS